MNRIFESLISAFLYTFSLLPLSILYFFSKILFFISFYLLKYRSYVVYSNLKKSFPDKNKKEINQIAKGFYKHFSDLVFETLKLTSISSKELKKRIKIKNIELVDKLYSENKSVILYLGHYGNWEWLAVLPLLLKHKVLTFYQSLSSSYMDKHMKSLREKFGVKAIESHSGYKNLVNYSEQNICTFTLMIGDQGPAGPSKKYWTNFLNQETAYLVGADRIARRVNHAIVYPFVEKIRRGYYEIEFKFIELNPEKTELNEVIEKFSQQLEANIQHNPSLWLWSHRRWKRKRKIENMNN
ncbi:lysophospholipid acyltransferase family protein [Bacteroidota bacterium]